MCDAISFGAAPAFLLLKLCQDWSDKPIVAKAVAVLQAAGITLFQGYYFAKPALMALPDISMLSQAVNMRAAV